MTPDKYLANAKYVIDAEIPYAEKYDIKFAIHPDDPPFSIFGLPRLIFDESSISRFLALSDSGYHGLTLCTGSLGSDARNDVPSIIRKFADRIHFAHVRNLKFLGNGDFYESAHLSDCGSFDLYEVMRALYESGFDGYIRPDHGRMIWGETGRPGYGLYDRALGVAYLNGLWEALSKGEKR
jgi:mannonate dehydratase